MGFSMPTPYYEHKGITIYHGDCREILPQLGRFDLLLTDPPYGIGRANGMGGGGYSGFAENRTKRVPRDYEGGWDKERPDCDTMLSALGSAAGAIIWGGNYFADMLPQGQKWLIWDKQQTMPSFSDAELAWTNARGTSLKMYRLCGAGMMAAEQNRVHPTQKPLALMKWCLTFFPDAQSVLDPFCGSGTSLVAAKEIGLTAVGIEREEKYCEIAAKRLSQEVLQYA